MMAWSDVVGFGAALGGGLLIGLDRERHKRLGDDREAAGIRTFAIAAMAGAVAQWLASPALVAIGAVCVAGLTLIAYARSRSRDPGMTTEIALFVTYLIGVLAMRQPSLGGAAAVLVSLLLASRQRLHRLATTLLTEAELRDALLLAALVLVLLPLTPTEPLTWAGGLNLRTVIGLLVLILLMQSAAHAALRLVGPRAGMALAGALAGFVSSTAAIASLGVRAREQPQELAACAAGGIFSIVATWLLALVILLALSPSLAWALLPGAAAGGAVAACLGAWHLRRAPDGVASAGPAHGPLRWREAATMALLLAGIGAGVAFAQRYFGNAGLWIGSAIGALADAHSSIAAIGQLRASDQVTQRDAIAAVLTAIAANSVSRAVVAVLSGGTPYAVRVGTALAASVAAALAIVIALY